MKLKGKLSLTRMVDVFHQFYYENIRTIRPAIFEFDCKTYSKSAFRGDAFAGLNVAVLTFPLAMAIGVASGLTIQAGLISAIVGSALIAIFSGARTQIAGPTAALAMLTLGITENFGFNGVYWVMLMAAVLLMLGGLFGLGSVIKFVPQPVLIGFTAGIAVNIVFSQLKDFLGMPITHLEADFMMRLKVYAAFWNDVRFWTIGIGSLALVIIVLFRWLLPAAPGGPLVAISICSVAVWLFDIPVECLRDRFGDLRFGLDFLKNTAFDWTEIFDVFPHAFSIAFVVAVEGLLAAKVADSMTGEMHRPNTELIGEGIANGMIALFAGIPVAGSISRTAMNIKGGATTFISGVMHAAYLLLFGLTLMPLAGYVPFCVLSAILFLVAWNISHAADFIETLFSGFEEALLLLLTFVLTIVQGVSTGIAVGVIMASLLFMKRMSEMTRVKPHSLIMGKTESHSLPEGVYMYSIDGPFFFGSASRIRALMDLGKETFDVYIIHLEHTLIIDVSAIKTLEHFVRDIVSHNNDVIICSEESSVIHAMQRYLSYDLVPKTHRTKSVTTAIDLARVLVSTRKGEVKPQ